MTQEELTWKDIGRLFKRTWRERGIRIDAHEFDKWWANRNKYPLMFDSSLYLRAFHIHQQLSSKNQDHVVVITGGTGTGKSHLAGQLAKTVCPTTTLNDYVYSYEDFMSKVNELINRKIEEHQFKKDYEAEHGEPPSKDLLLSKFPIKALIFDEAVQNLSSKDAMSKQSKQIEQALMQIRAVNVFIILCIPSFFSLNRYTREERTYTLIRCNGQSKPYTYDAYVKNTNEELDNIRAIAVKKKFLAGKTESDRWTGDWYSYYPEDLNWEEYEIHKLKNIQKNVSGYVKGAKQEEYLSSGQAAKELGISWDTVTRLFDKGIIEGHKVGTHRRFIARSVLAYKKSNQKVLIS